MPQQDSRAKVVANNFRVVEGSRCSVFQGEQGATPTEAGEKNVVILDDRIAVVRIPVGFPWIRQRSAPEQIEPLNVVRQR
jgi:hypothetical protein